jgi:hypothetical protein
MVVNAFTEGCISQTFRASALIAEAHSPNALSSICSHRPGLEHGWFAKRSPTVYERNVPCLAAVLRASTVSVPALQSSWQNVTLKSALPHRRDVPHTSHTPYACKSNEPIVHSILPTAPPEIYATAPAYGVVALCSVSRPVASIISPYVQHTGRSMSADTKSLTQPSRVVLGASTSLREMKAIFGDVLCSLLQCPPAYSCGSGNQRLVSEGTAIHKERFGERLDVDAR